MDTTPPTAGETVRVYLWPDRQPEPFELVGTVVGQCSDGFAIEYEAPSQELCQSIDALQIGTGPRGA